MGSFNLPKIENLQLFDIDFDNATSVVYAGQELRGRVMVMFGDELGTIRAVKIRIFGRSRTSWPDDRCYRIPVQERSVEQVLCCAEELIFDITLNLHGRPPGQSGSVRKNGRRREELPVGVYEYPFRFGIPTGCPTTYEGAHGYIRYVCCASLSTTQKHDRQAKRAFTVIHPCDLNSFSLDNDVSVDEPVINESSVVLHSGCFFRKVDEITVTAALPKSGYVCGEHIPIWVNIVNNSGQKIKKVKATLLQRVRFKSRYRGNVPRERVEYRVVSQVYTKEELGARWGLIWDQESIRIPPLPPTIDGMSDLIQVDYGLVIEAGSVSLALPIHIGTIPLKSAIKALRSCYQTDILAVPPTRYSTDFLPLPPCWNRYVGKFPPPSYCKDKEVGPISIRERADSEYAPGQLEYEPHYPYYGSSPEEFSLTKEVDDTRTSAVSVFQ